VRYVNVFDRNAATRVEPGRVDKCFDADPFDWEVIVASPRWVLNGVNIFSEQLVRGLNSRGVRSHVLLTGSNEDDLKPLPLPSDIPFRHLPIRSWWSWEARWNCMIEYLRDRAPCIYIPNHDFAYSCVAPALPEDVGVVGVVHSDDPQHYAHARHLGRFWNATVGVSQAIVENLGSMEPGLQTRLRVIEYGVPAASKPMPRPADEDRPLRIIYAGRLVQEQKRVLDLPRIVDGLERLGVSATLTVVGGGADRKALESASAQWVDCGVIRFAGILSNADVIRELRAHDALLLVSDYEGLPITVLEAMAAGCVPVVTALRSGIPELVRNGENGFTVDVGDIEAFVERLATLQREPHLRERLSARAFETLHENGFTLDAMTERYLDLFRVIGKELEDGAFRRPSGRVESVPWARPSWKDRLPSGLRRALSRARTAQRRWTS
jgi:glycosyltransferase involved in cell wall biosynthesis